MKIGVTMPIGTQQLSSYPVMALAAEDAGFDSVWSFELYSNPLVIMALAATSTNRIQLGTGVATAFTRTPFELANAAVDADEISGGRVRLGVGMGLPFMLSTFNATPFSRPLQRMRDYVEVLKRSSRYLSSGAADSYRGEHFSFFPPPINPLGSRGASREIEILVGGMGPRMSSLAAEIADGHIGGGHSREYYEGVIVPALQRGAESRGRPYAQVERVVQVVCCVSDDRDEALRRARIHVGQLVASPVQDAAVAFHGLQDEVSRVRQVLATEGPGALATVTDMKLVDAFSISGTPADARRALENWSQCVDHIMLHPPYVAPFTRAEAADGFHQIVSAFARK